MTIDENTDKNGRVIDPANGIDGILDIYIENETIEEVGSNLDYSGADIEQIDASGKIVAPGLVDMHCHLREPGQEYKEDIETGTQSAAMGGLPPWHACPTPILWWTISRLWNI